MRKVGGQILFNKSVPFFLVSSLELLRLFRCEAFYEKNLFERFLNEEFDHYTIGLFCVAIQEVKLSKSVVCVREIKLNLFDVVIDFVGVGDGNRQCEYCSVSSEYRQWNFARKCCSEHLDRYAIPIVRFHEGREN